ncbi:hypothetical protein [Thermus sp.]
MGRRAGRTSTRGHFITSVRTYRAPLRGEEALEVLEKEAREGKLSREAVRALKSGLLRNRVLASR